MTIRSGNIFLLALIPCLMALIFAVETIIPQVTLTTIPSRPLQTFFGPRLVVHLSDLHLVHLGWREQLILKKLEQIHPDLIFMTGDYLEPYTDLADLRNFLSQVAAIAPVVATPGNNDYCCLDTLAALMRQSGITFMRNQAILLGSDTDSMYVIGLEDNFLRHDDYYQASSGVPPKASRIVLGHAPAVAEAINPDGVVLVLAGHLHGGQIILPIYGPASRSGDCGFATRMYIAGLYEVNGFSLYSNRGIGTSIVPVRFLARPEIAVFKFTS